MGHKGTFWNEDNALCVHKIMSYVFVKIQWRNLEDLSVTFVTFMVKGENQTLNSS